MEFKIEKKEKFNIVGVSKRVPIQFEGVNNAILELAQSIIEQQRNEMRQLADLVPHQVLNVSYDFEEVYLEENGYLTHMIGFATTKENPYDDLNKFRLKKVYGQYSLIKGHFLLPFKKQLQKFIRNGYHLQVMN
ncbi:MAG: AraC family transcriptional regulator [Bacillales bacterium]|jgi:AraC family transcriptional regulator|nr:AraC family transcriptional regulator [Bacillales bacterium]